MREGRSRPSLQNTAITVGGTTLAAMREGRSRPSLPVANPASDAKARGRNEGGAKPPLVAQSQGQAQAEGKGPQ